jgi:S1-C subfamily serine protease
MTATTTPVAIDSINYSVTLVKTRVRGEAPQQCVVASATGFFFQDHERKFLITNRHVVIKEEDNFYPDNLLIRVHTSRQSTLPNRDVVIPLYNTNHEQLWLEHQNREIDVVAIRVDDLFLDGDVIEPFTPQNIPPSNIRLGVRDNCMVIGYPLGFHDDFHNLPITRVGTIASPYGAFFKEQRHFLLDAILHPGTSGSPVVLPSTRDILSITEVGQVAVARGFPTYLLGINSGEYSGLSLNAVWYSDLIQEIIPPPV